MHTTATYNARIFPINCINREIEDAGLIKLNITDQSFVYYNSRCSSYLKDWLRWLNIVYVYSLNKRALQTTLLFLKKFK